VPSFALPIGTRVRLASGSPEMLIVDHDADRGEFICAFKFEGRAIEHSFKPIVLDIERGPIVRLEL